MQNKETLAANIFAAFNFDQDQPKEIVTFESQVSAWEEKTNQLVSINPSNIKTIQDKDFMDTAFKTLVKVGMKALEKMENDLKMGSPAKDKEALALMQTAVTESLEKMSQYLFKLNDIDMYQNNAVPAVQQNVQNVFNIEASANDLADMVDAARKRSEINGVEAKFKIETEKSFD